MILKFIVTKTRISLLSTPMMLMSASLLWSLPSLDSPGSTSTSLEEIVREIILNEIIIDINNLNLFLVFQTIGLAARSGQDYSSYDYDYNTEHLQSTSSFSEKASELFQEMGKVQDSFIHRDPSPYHKYNRNQAQY